MEYYSHIYKQGDNQITEKKLLKRHLKNAASIALGNLSTGLKFNIQKNILDTFTNDICLLHDLGKYTVYFQNYLTGKAKGSDLSNHSHIGAYYIYNKYIADNPKLALLGYYIIKNHHANFNDFNDESIFSSDERILLKEKLSPQFLNLEENLKNIENDLDTKIIKAYIAVPEKPLFYKIRQIDKQPSIENYYLINYLFSLLIEADKLDASNTKQYTRIEIDKESVSTHLKNNKSDDNFINKIRSEIRDEVKEKLTKEYLLSNNIFTLTAPTGSGKTLLNLEFALQLRNVLKEETGNYPQIIYSLPFISIIEQTEQVIKSVLGNNAKILAHYQFSDLFDPDFADNESLTYSNKLQILETWQSDIVVTSFVQLLQTLIGNRNKFLKKFHHFANSIIILDEVQALKAEYLPLIGAALYYLTKFLNCKIIFSTATRPFIFELANSVLLNNSEKTIFSEIFSNHIIYFNKFNRTKLIPILEKVLDIDEFFELFNSKYNRNKSCLIVCNTINNSLKIFDRLEKEYGEENVFYLSTNIIPLQKEKVLKEIKERLNDKEKQRPILVSTQVIEAGVDLDFEMGFRELSPIDSIIQTAGRVNRNNLLSEIAPIYIFNLGTCARVYGSIAQFTSLSVLKNDIEITEQKYLETINNYFITINKKQSFKDSTNIFEAMLNLKYHSTGDKKGVSDFKLIEDDAFENSVFVELDEDAADVYQRYSDFINKKITKEEFVKYVKQFNKYVISIPSILLDKTDLKGIGKNFYYIKNEILEYFYKTKTGFIRKEDGNLCL
jgi:CRISPR-associated endonuclease/helicase Cas3